MPVLFSGGIICGLYRGSFRFGIICGTIYRDHYRSGDHLRSGTICGAVQMKVKIFGWSQGRLKGQRPSNNLSITEFEVRAVSDGTIVVVFFFNERKRGALAYSSDRENEVSDIFILFLRLIRCAGKKLAEISIK